MSKARAKGTRYENQVVEFLIANGFPHAERRAMAGSLDKGDITGVPGIVFECKNHKETNLSGWMKETDAEVTNAGADFGAICHPRRGYAMKSHYVTMTLDSYARLLKAAGYGA